MTRKSVIPRAKPEESHNMRTLINSIFSIIQHSQHMKRKQYYIYIMMNKWNTTSYIGVTSDLAKRVWQHKQKEIKGFTEKYNLTKLVYYEVFKHVRDAIMREKQLKKWSREKKIRLIKKQNPQFRDLFDDM